MLAPILARCASVSELSPSFNSTVYEEVVEIMPDHRRHRGPHPEDRRLFAPATHGTLRRATDHLSWLLSRGYAIPSSLKLVGDRFSLTERQRIAVKRSACTDAQEQSRRHAEIGLDQIRGEDVWIDGFNLLTTIESAMSHGVLLWGRDNCVRDMASMHGSYRRVRETTPALELIGTAFEDWGIRHARWLLDRPVSNSGRLKGIMETIAVQHGWNWSIELHDDPDQVLSHSVPCTVISADSQILDHCQQWFNAALHLAARLPGELCLVNLRAECEPTWLQPASSIVK